MTPRMRPADRAWAPRLEVTSWPFDERARGRLTEYRHERMRDLDVAFPGDDLDLRGAHLCGFDFRQAGFSLAVLDKVRMLGANLSGAALVGASLEQVDFTGCVLERADLSDSRCRRAVLAWARLAHAELYNADLREADLLGAELEGAALTGADLRGARLTEAKFGRSALGHARLADTVLAGARGSVFGPVDISKTDEPTLVDGEEMVRWFREQQAWVIAARRVGAAQS